jgi:hypothetical protein
VGGVVVTPGVGSGWGEEAARARAEASGRAVGAPGNPFAGIGYPRPVTGRGGPFAAPWRAVPSGRSVDASVGRIRCDGGAGAAYARNLAAVMRAIAEVPALIALAEAVVRETGLDPGDGYAGLRCDALETLARIVGPDA